LTPAELDLVPAPQELTLTGGRYRLPRTGTVALAPELLDDARRPGLRICEAVSRLGCEWSVVGDWPGSDSDVVLRFDDQVPEQGYLLRIDADRVTIAASGGPGLAYGASTLIQLIRHAGPDLPTVAIADQPAIERRSLMIDISRDRVPTMETLYALVDMMEAWKLNELQLYTEHTFAYRDHRDVWVDASPMTPHEIIALDAYCRDRHVELVPNQNSLGHLHKWLRHPPYAHLAELERFEERQMWGHWPFSLDVTNPASLDFVLSLYDELLPNFSSRTVNIGLDETVDLGTGRSRDAADLQGVGNLYLGWLRVLAEDLASRGYDVQIWGDILAERTELIEQLPARVSVGEWGYEAGHPFDERAARFVEAGVPFYLCVGTSSWRTIGGRTANMLANLAEGAHAAVRHGARGYMITDWGWFEGGTWQPWAVSCPGFLAGAAFAWNPASADSMDLAGALDREVFGDEAGQLGGAYLALGDVCEAFDWRPADSSALFWVMQEPMAWTRETPGLNEEAFNRALAQVDAAEAAANAAWVGEPQGRIARGEFALAAALMRHGVRRGLAAVAGFGQWPDTSRAELRRDLSRIVVEFEEIWLRRHRPGGLPKTRARLLTMGDDYADVDG
jgi:hexosaminidase